MQGSDSRRVVRSFSARALPALALAVLAGCPPPPPPAPPAESPPLAPAAAERDPGLGAPTSSTPQWTPVVRRMSATPMTLTASDGSALRLVAVRARTVVEDPLAFTELELEFDNPQERRLEGRFDIALPSGAAISRFAMKIGDQWQEGEMVERAKSQRAYEDFLHRGIDPALLEHAGGNRFSARVFPIERRQTKTIRVSYSQELGSRPVLVPLQGLPAVDEVDVAVSAVGVADAAQWLQCSGCVPKGDFGLDASLRTESAGLRSGSVLLARVKPQVDVGMDHPLDAMILVDTSGSRAMDFETQLETVAGLARGLGAEAEARLAVAAFDQERQLVFEGRARDFDTRALTTLRARGPLGASDLPAALRWAGREAEARHLTRVILVGDGVTTAGDGEGADVNAATKKLAQHGVTRVDVVAVGGIRDDDALRRLVHTLPRIGGSAGVVLDPADGARELVRRLKLGVGKVRVGVPGAKWFGPDRERWIQPGEEVLVYAELHPGQTPQVSIDGVTRPLGALRTVPRPLLERSWAKARIDFWLDRAAREGSSPAIDEAIVALSTKYRVLAPQTAMVVLEREEDFARWSIDRDALADILTIDPQGRVVTISRQAPVLAPGAAPRFNGGGATRDQALSEVPPPSGNRRGDSFGTGGLGLSGIGEGGGGLGNAGTVGGGTGEGFGSGSGRLGRSRRARLPRVRRGRTSVSGRLPPEVIQRIVRQNFGRFRLCYERGLRKNPTLAGRVMVRFVIARDGGVSSVGGGGDIGDQAVVSCVTRAFYGLSFPQPEGGIVTVSYPIIFSPGGARPGGARVSRPPPPPPPPPPPKPDVATPVPGELGVVQGLLASGEAASALRRAEAWHAASPGDVMALVALGETLTATGEMPRAARAYGSLIDLFPSRADLRRFAGNRLQALGLDAANALALDTYRQAVRQRPDHPSGHRLLAFAQLEGGDPAGAFTTLEKALGRAYPSGRFAGVGSVLKEDLGLVAAAWIASDRSARKAVVERLEQAGATLATRPSLRFVLTWETDNSDVDLHVYDGRGHAGGWERDLKSGGSVLANVTSGYGPEVFRLDGPRRAKAYQLQVRYRRKGAMGYGMGMVQIVGHDGRGGLTFDERPFVALTAGALVDLGTL